MFLWILLSLRSDLNTDVVKDIVDSQGFSLKGATTMTTAYCYHSQLSDNQDELSVNLLILEKVYLEGFEVRAGVLIYLAGGHVE